MNIQLVQENAQIANDNASKALAGINRFVAGEIAGVNYTSAQKDAMRTEFDAAINAARTAADAVITELNAN